MTPLTEKEGTDIQRGVGRPPLELDLVEQKVYLAKQQLHRVRELVGKQGLSKFMREAVERELERREAEASED